MGKKHEYLIARERAKGEEGRPSTKTAFARDFRFNQLFRVGSLLTLRLTLRSPLTSKGRTPIYLKISSSGIWEIVRRGREVLCQSYTYISYGVRIERELMAAYVKVSITCSFY